MTQPHALIVGAGAGLSASLARQLAAKGYGVTLAARNIEKLSGLAKEIGAGRIACDISVPEQVKLLFEAIDQPLRVAIANPSARVRGPIAELDPEVVRKSIEVTAYGSFLIGQAATKRMLALEPLDGKRGTILFTGASAGVKGFAQSASFAMGKFAQRGLAQSMARELHPQGIHVSWINIDGGIGNPGCPDSPGHPERSDSPDSPGHPGRVEAAGQPDSMLNPDAIAKAYMGLIDQDRSAWSDEMTLRPWVERF